MKNLTFINAGAGSGKTYYLTEKLVECVKKSLCHSDEVMLTTFGVAAAAEIRAKAREAMIANGMPEEANLLASAAMGTIHSVALQFIKNYWYHIGLPAELNVMPQADVSFFFNQALSQIPEPEELERLRDIANKLRFTRYGEYVINEDQWKDDLDAIIKKALSNSIFNLDDCMRKSLDELHSIYPAVNISANHTLIRSQLVQIRGILTSEKQNPTTEKRIETTESLLTEKEFTLPLLFMIKTFFAGLPQGIRNTVNGCDETMAQLANLHYSKEVTSCMEDYVKIIFSLAGRSMERFMEYKREQKLVDYNDMEFYFLELLKKPDVVADIRKRCRRIFVDEFQDSSPVQVKIFVRLSEIAEHSYWVGDPKQAIYNFRGTDPILINIILGKINVENIEDLGSSWRSRPALVNLTNKIFTRALADQVRDASKIALKAVRPANELCDGDLGFPVRHWHFDDDIGNRKENLDNYLPILMADFVGDPERKVVDREKSRYNPDKSEYHTVLRKMEPGDVAVLRSKNRRISSLATAMKEVSLKSASREQNLSATAEIQLLVSALNYLIDEKDSLAKASLLLLSGEFGTAASLTDDRLAFINSMGEPPAEDPNSEEIREVINQYYNTLHGWHSEAALVKQVDTLRNTAGKYDVPSLVQAITSLTGINDLVVKWDNSMMRQANLQTALRLADAYDERCIMMNIGSSLRGFIDYLSIQGGNEEEEGVPQPKAKDAFNILTYHRSKGLEWPVVILTDIDDDVMNEQLLMSLSFHGVSWDKEAPGDDPFGGQSIILLPWPFGPKNTKVPEDVANTIRAGARFTRMRQLKEEEQKRLLYVGMTRARDYLITVSYKNNDLKWLNLVLDNPETINRCQSLQDGTNRTDLFGSGQQVLAEKTVFITGGETSDRIPTPVRQGSVEPIFEVYKRTEINPQTDPMYRSPSAEKVEDNVRIEEVRDFRYRIEVNIPDSAEAVFGDCLHSIFYHYNPTIDKTLFLKKANQLIYSHNFGGLMPYSEHAWQAIKNLYDYMTEKYGPALKVYRELPLSMANDGYIWRGAADMVWETAGGLIIIDYKSYPGRKDNLFNPLNDKFAGRYSGQLSAYKRMAEAAHPDGKKVTETLIYYSVIGLVLKLS